jgi:hypothetical protein
VPGASSISTVNISLSEGGKKITGSFEKSFMERKNITNTTTMKKYLYLSETKSSLLYMTLNKITRDLNFVFFLLFPFFMNIIQSNGIIVRERSQEERRARLTTLNKGAVYSPVSDSAR